MNKEKYIKLLYNYERSSIKICVEKCCNYRFIFFLNEYQNLSDIYNYVVSFYSHITKPIHLFIDKERKIEIPNNNKILIKKYFLHNRVLSSSNVDTPVIYKLYMDLCPRKKHTNLDNLIFV
jgi:hypothetical protein